MKYIHGTREFELDRPCIVTLGKFDGFHLGHRKLIQYAVSRKNENLNMAVFTFSTSPQSFMTGRSGEVLSVGEDRLKLAQNMGVDVLVEYPFTDEVRHMDARIFLEEVLVRQMKLQEIVVGPDCRFGYKGQGNVALLREGAARLGYQVTVLDKELYRGEVISSSRIKDCLREGQIEDANRMLGYRYGISGPVIHGKKLGRTLGFPTINQEVAPEQLMPRAGVYRSEVRIDGQWYRGISNVGRKPTIAGQRPIGVETHIFDYNCNIYDKNVRVNFLNFVRPERKFDSLEALRNQIREDSEKCMNFLD